MRLQPSRNHVTRGPWVLMPSRAFRRPNRRSRARQATRHPLLGFLPLQAINVCSPNYYSSRWSTHYLEIRNSPAVIFGMRGKVYRMVDATDVPVAVGGLLATSSISGPCHEGHRVGGRSSEVFEPTREIRLRTFEPRRHAAAQTLSNALKRSPPARKQNHLVWPLLHSGPAFPPHRLRLSPRRTVGCQGRSCCVKNR